MHHRDVQVERWQGIGGSVERVAVVTGASRGIGAEIAKSFARWGYTSVITFRSRRALAEEVVEAIGEAGGRAISLQVDVRSDASVLSMLDGVGQAFGRIDALVCNAVDEVIKPIDEASLEEWHVPLLTKLDGAFLCTKHAIPLLQESDNPSITYVTSVDGERPNGDYIGYQVGTAGLMAMTKANAVYLGRKYGIRVNAVAPGPVRTEL